MRPSTVLMISAGIAVSACATAEELGISSLHGTTFGGFDSGSPADSGAFGGAPGAGGALPMGSGGSPIGAGGIINAAGGGAGIGGSAQGGQAGAGGSGPPPGSGGQGPSSSGGVSATGGGGATTGCSGNEKSCGGVCVAPSPANGCGATDCTACSNTAPAHGFQTCNAQGQCDFDCFSGYTKNGTMCGTGSGAGGSTGGGGDGGLGVTSCTSADGTHTSQCPSHCLSNQQTCCQQSNLKNFALCICADSLNQRVLCGL